MAVPGGACRACPRAPQPAAAAAPHPWPLSCRSAHCAHSSSAKRLRRAVAQQREAEVDNTPRGAPERAASPLGQPSEQSGGKCSPQPSQSPGGQPDAAGRISLQAHAAPVDRAKPAGGPDQPAAPNENGPALVAAGAFVCSLISLQLKLTDEPVEPLAATALGAALAWAATAALMRASGVSPTGSCQARAPETLALLASRGLLAAVQVVCYYAAIERLPLPIAVGLFFVHPLIALLAGAAASGARVPFGAAASCCLCVLGVLVIGFHEAIAQAAAAAGAGAAALAGGAGARAAAAAAAAALDAAGGGGGEQLPLSGVLLGLAAAAANAGAFVCVNLIGPGVSPLCVTWWQQCVVTHACVGVLAARALAGGELGLLQLAAISGGGLVELAEEAGEALPSTHDVWLLLGVAAANTAGQLLLNSGFQRIDAGRGSAINTSQVLWGCLWQVSVMHEPASASLLLGSTCISAGVVLTELSIFDPSKPQQQQQQQQRQQQQQQQQQQQRQLLVEHAREQQQRGG